MKVEEITTKTKKEIVEFMNDNKPIFRTKTVLKIKIDKPNLSLNELMRIEQLINDLQ